MAVPLAVAIVLALVLGTGGGRRALSAGHAVAPRARRPLPRRSTPIAVDELRTDERILFYTSYVWLGTRHRRDVALTFDDGPGPFTLRILAALERFHARATFFEIGREVRAHPRITQRLARAGMVVGDHTEHHPQLTRLPPERQAAEIDQAAREIRAAGAPWPALFRPPYGSFDSATLGLLRSRRMLMALWTVDTRDYAGPGVRRIVYAALSGARPGAIILFHDGGGDRSQTLAALPRVLERLRRRRYRLVTLPELLQDDPPPAGQPPPRSLAGD